MKYTGYIVIFLHTVFSVLSAYALEPLRPLTRPLSQRTMLSLEDYTAAHLKIPLEAFEILPSDLNTDGTNEYLLRPVTCANDPVTPCPYTILGETPQGIIPLGVITGKKIVLGDGFSHGVRNILAFENDINDYDYTLYTWQPDTTSYGKQKHDAKTAP